MTRGLPGDGSDAVRIGGAVLRQVQSRPREPERDLRRDSHGCQALPRPADRWPLFVANAIASDHWHARLPRVRAQWQPGRAARHRRRVRPSVRNAGRRDRWRPGAKTSSRQRVPLVARARIYGEVGDHGDKPAVETITVNISQTGVLVERRPGLGERLQLAIELSGSRPHADPVRRARRTAHSHTPRAGVR